MLINHPGGDFNRDGVTDGLDWADYESARDNASTANYSPACGVMGWGDVLEPRIGYAGYVRAEWTSTVSFAINLKGSFSGVGG
ncbi:MAG: hypothetical protein Q8L55_13425, partial [Phycisphaerales bacterium]|nr:hypothetical protein [Phycisphaerales bacterium]